MLTAQSSRVKNFFAGHAEDRWQPRATLELMVTPYDKVSRFCPPPATCVHVRKTETAEMGLLMVEL